MLLTVENNIPKQPSTLNSFLSTNTATGGTVLPIKNNNGFNVQWAVQVGATGEEQAEILNISSIGGTALNTSGTIRFPHQIDTPVYQLHYDQIIWLKSTSGTAGTALAIATTNITPDSVYTEYNDASGAATYAYQVQYYNSITGDTSGTSSWFIPGGPTFYSFQKLRQRSKDALYSANYIRNDSIINDWINEWVERMTNAAIKVNQGYSVGTALYTFAAPAGTPALALGTVTDSAFKQAYKVELSYDGGIHWTNSRELPLNEFSVGDYYSSLDPRHVWQGDTTFIILPGGTGGIARLTYGQRTTLLVNDTDELPQSMKAYTTGCIEYVLYRAFDLDQKSEQAGEHFQKYTVYQTDFIQEITPRDQSGPKMIMIGDSLSGLEESVNLINEYFL